MVQREARQLGGGPVLLLGVFREAGAESIRESMKLRFKWLLLRFRHVRELFRGTRSFGVPVDEAASLVNDGFSQEGQGICYPVFLKNISVAGEEGCDERVAVHCGHALICQCPHAVAAAGSYPDTQVCLREYGVCTMTL